jgi:predicted dehydrogenase
MLKFALVGCGRISKRHSELLGMNQIEGARLVAACDLDVTKAADIGKKFSIPYLNKIH